MIAGFILSFVYIVLLLYDFKKGVIWTAMTIQFVSYIGTGFPGLKIFTVIVAFSFILYFLNLRTISQKPYPRPLLYASLIFLTSFLATLFVSRWLHWSTVLTNALTYFLFPFLFWKSLKSKKEVDFALKIFYYMMWVGVVFGMYELITRYNIAFDIIQSTFTLEDFSIDSSTIRFGLKRCNSFFSYFSTYGMASFIAFVVFYSKNRWLNDGTRNFILLAILCAFAAFSSGSRAVFLGLFLALAFLLYDRKFLESKTGIFLIVIVLVLFPIIFTVLSQVLDSMVNSDNSRFVSGSSSEMRLIQWEACESYFLNSPWFGNGRMYIWDVVRVYHYELLGAESIWFSILVDYGLLGAFAFLFLIYSCCKCLWQYSKRLICLPIGYLLIVSLSPDQGIQYNMLITSTILIVRMFQSQTKNSLNLKKRKVS